MDNDNLKLHIDKRFDKLEDTVKLYGEQLVVHKTQIASPRLNLNNSPT